LLIVKLKDSNFVNLTFDFCHLNIKWLNLNLLILLFPEKGVFYPLDGFGDSLVRLVIERNPEGTEKGESCYFYRYFNNP
jgi:hypothetical protein